MQINEINRYVDLIKEENKNSYVVLEIYDHPLPPEAANNSKYLQFVQDILLFDLAEENQRTVYKSKNELVQLLGLVNNQYISYKKKKNDLVSIDSRMNEWEINEFYKRCDAKIYSIIESSLKSLKKRLLLDYSDAYKIFYRNESGEQRCRIANNLEHSLILKVKHDIMEEMGFSSEYQIYLDYDKRVYYYNRINENLKELRNWEGVFQCYKIIYDPYNAIKAINSDMEKMRLNDLMIEAIDKQAISKYNKSLESSFVYPKDYIEMQALLSEKLIKIKKEPDVNENLNA